MIDADILDGIQKALKERDKNLVVGNDLMPEELEHNASEDRVFVRRVTGLLGQREKKGYKRIFR